MNSSDQNITVVYKWTAKAGQIDKLKAIYSDVCREMEENEPGTLSMQYFFDADQQALVVIDVFKDGQALGYHLMETAGKHFPSLVDIAVPGPFLFCGDVPDQLRQAAEGMRMGAEFSTAISGFSRS